MMRVIVVAASDDQVTDTAAPMHNAYATFSFCHSGNGKRRS
ncbi:hypothetical protein MicloDRAFT_00000890 [Microvirga lotononidis]|uniref:Uncharacterized protein n=1 Tax=Microvirga lotononidis TaxID=864069 RepID=I4Z4F9_9HYPH|nr:hypothetical protein MicloDRAFT_00000890 [Microvirga lotononidis]